jgi:hypothetical protein
VRDERGSVVVGILAAIGLVVVIMGLILGGCFANAGASQVQRRHRQPSCDQGYDDGGRNCNDGTQGGGNGNKGRDGDEQRGDKNCHSFCGNTVIIPNPMEPTTTTTAGGSER